MTRSFPTPRASDVSPSACSRCCRTRDSLGGCSTCCGHVRSLSCARRFTPSHDPALRDPAGASRRTPLSRHLPPSTDPDPAGQRFMLPAWIPGSYMIREFARQHRPHHARSRGDRKVALDKLDKHTWRAAPCRGPLDVAYEVYAWDLSVRAAHLDETHGFFNGTCVFLLPLGREDDACEVDILPPDGARYADWRVATDCPARGARPLGFGSYRGRRLRRADRPPGRDGRRSRSSVRRACGVPHEIAITGRSELDLERLARDLKRVCEVADPPVRAARAAAPFDRYVFLTLARRRRLRRARAPQLDRAALQARRPAARRHEGLDRGLSHLPRAREPRVLPQLERQAHQARPRSRPTTSTQRELHPPALGCSKASRRTTTTCAGALRTASTPTQYLETLGRHDDRSPAAQRPAQAERSRSSSFDAWIKYYRQDENSPNAIVSYYGKGALVALALDLTIRAAPAAAARSTTSCARSGGAGRTRATRTPASPRRRLRAEIAEATGVDVARALREWTEGTSDPDFAQLFAPFGIACGRRAALDSPHFALLGIKTAARSRCRIAHVFDGSAAQRAGLSGGDIARRPRRTARDAVDDRQAAHALRAGRHARVAAFRRDELMQFDVQLAQQPPAATRSRSTRRGQAAASRACARAGSG